MSTSSIQLSYCKYSNRKPVTYIEHAPWITKVGQAILSQGSITWLEQLASSVTGKHTNICTRATSLTSFIQKVEERGVVVSGQVPTWCSHRPPCTGTSSTWVALRLSAPETRNTVNTTGHPRASWFRVHSCFLAEGLVEMGCGERALPVSLTPSHIWET